MGMATYFISIPEYYAPYCKRAYMTSSNKKDEEKEDEENAEDADDGSFWWKKGTRIWITFTEFLEAEN